jgi:hypothetical protein
MAIPEAQLETWSHQGSVAQSSATYNAIKNVLEGTGTPYTGKGYEVFLQGSYGNDTNIYAESDVDTVVLLHDCWHSDLTKLPPDETAAYHNTYPKATYCHVEFKGDVVDTLKHAFGSDVNIGSKAITIAARDNRRRADVIAAVEFRRYHKFKNASDQSYDEGICFFNAAGEKIANYPKQHAANLTLKHQQTSGWLKPCIRFFKNLRGRLVDDGRIRTGTAPSYYLEGLLYNVPSEKYGTSYGTCFVNAINWIQNEADKSKLVCANEQYYLLWDNTPTSWPKANCEAFLQAAIDFWNKS